MGNSDYRAVNTSIYATLDNNEILEKYVLFYLLYFYNIKQSTMTHVEMTNFREPHKSVNQSNCLVNFRNVNKSQHYT